MGPLSGWRAAAATPLVALPFYVSLQLAQSLSGRHAGPTGKTIAVLLALVLAVLAVRRDPSRGALTTLFLLGGGLFAGAAIAGGLGALLQTSLGLSDGPFAPGWEGGASGFVTVVAFLGAVLGAAAGALIAWPLLEPSNASHG